MTRTMTTTTWTDGFGLWHARVDHVTDSEQAEATAHTAILDQVNQRQRTPCPPEALRLRCVQSGGGSRIYSEVTS